MEDDVKAVNLNMDLSKLHELMRIGLRRASAFVRLGLDGIDGRAHEDFMMYSNIGLSFWPQKISDEDKQNAKSEYEAWLVGSCLKEVDQYFEIFLNRAGFFADAIELSGTKIPSNTVLGAKVLKESNLAKKQKLLAGQLGSPDYSMQIRSLRAARNDLTHNAGHVTERNCTDDAKSEQKLVWNGMRFLLERDGQSHEVTHFPFDTKELPGEGDMNVLLEVVERTITFKKGEKIKIATEQFADICMFYDHVAATIVKGVFEKATEKQAVRD